MGAARADLVAMGIPKEAIKLVVAYEKMDPDKRKSVDSALAYLRNIRKLPVQGDLFVPQEPQESGGE